MVIPALYKNSLAALLSDVTFFMALSKRSVLVFPSHITVIVFCVVIFYAAKLLKKTDLTNKSTTFFTGDVAKYRDRERQYLLYKLFPCGVMGKIFVQKCLI